ncbi:hypothetical protein B5F53_14325 [Blautia sp. An249]|nr:hypothetical protein B5F53_14325 [Blautia sp. An249]
MIAIDRKKEVCYLLQKTDTDPKEIDRKKERLKKQGYLVVTIIEGENDIKKGLQEVVRDHFYRSKEGR